MIPTALGVAAASAALSGLAAVWLRPWLASIALARPNARSSHVVPTPQGGGIGVVAATLATWLGALILSGLADGAVLPIVLGASLALGAIGFRDDVRPVSARLRLLVQFACVAPLVWASFAAMPEPAALPALLLCALLTVVGVWWVNVVNFMDGIDWITVSGVAPLCAAIAVFGLLGFVDAAVTLAAAALLGGLLGFAPANRPVARLFLGDVGSLPVGFLTGWMLLELARSGAIAAALLLPLYYGADATVTLLARMRRGETLSEAHRGHFYHRALQAGWSVLAIDRRVLGLTAVLALLAGATLRWPQPTVAVCAVAVGAVLVGWTLRDFSRPPRRVPLRRAP